MSYKSMIETLRHNVNDSCPESFLHDLVEIDYDRDGGFTRVSCPLSSYVDYLKEFDSCIIVLSDSDQWCDGPDDDGWTYVVFNSIEDYIEDTYEGGDSAILCDSGYDSFTDCFTAAAFDVLQNHNKRCNR